MDPTIAASLISAGAGFGAGALSSAGSGLFGINQARKNRAFQERMYKKQVEDNIKFWNMTNEYNLPSAQVARLRDANLSPLLMYGEGGMSGNLAQGSPDSATAPHGDKAQAQIGAEFNLANTELIKAQIDNLRADEMKKINEGLKASADTVKSHLDSDFAKDTWEYRKDQILADANLKFAMAQTEISKRNEIQTNIEHALTEIKLFENEIENRNKMTDQQIKESDQRIENSIKETAAAVNNMNAQARKAEADAFYSRAMAAIVSAPEYQKAAIKIKAEELRKAINDGNLSAIEAGLSAWLYDMRPKEGSVAYEYKRWIDLWVTPVTESLGKILGGSATYSFPTKKP